MIFNIHKPEINLNGYVEQISNLFDNFYYHDCIGIGINVNYDDNYIFSCDDEFFKNVTGSLNNDLLLELYQNLKFADINLSKRFNKGRLLSKYRFNLDDINNVSNIEEHLSVLSKSDNFLIFSFENKQGKDVSTFFKVLYKSDNIWEQILYSNIFWLKHDLYIFQQAINVVKDYNPNLIGS